MRRLLAAIRNLLGGAREDREMDAELRAYLACSVEERLQRGLTREQAEREARVELGGVEQVKESVRSARAGASIESIWRDVLYGVRALRRNPGFAAAAVATLALGIGVNASIFSIVNGLAFQPLPLPGSDRLVSLAQRIDAGGQRSVHGMPSFFCTLSTRRTATARVALGACIVRAVRRAAADRTGATRGGRRPHLVQLLRGARRPARPWPRLLAGRVSDRRLLAGDCAQRRVRRREPRLARDLVRLSGVSSRSTGRRLWSSAWLHRRV